MNLAPAVSIPIIEACCVGAGAGSELIALFYLLMKEYCYKTGSLSGNIDDLTFSDFEKQLSTCGVLADKIKIHVTDFADWNVVQQSIQECLRSNWADKSDHVQLNWVKANALKDLSIYEDLFQRSQLITFMFVLNELFATNKSDAARLLQVLMRSMKPNACLLVVESAGSFSSIKIGNKDFMIFQLLDAARNLECVFRDDATWFRYPTALADQSCLPLNNMRFFVRLYRQKEAK